MKECVDRLPIFKGQDETCPPVLILLEFKKLDIVLTAGRVGLSDIMSYKDL